MLRQKSRRYNGNGPYVPLKMLRQNATFLNPVLDGTGTSYFSRLYKRRFNRSFNFNSLL
jgi:hypothetical protein